MSEQENTLRTEILGRFSGYKKNRNVCNRIPSNIDWVWSESDRDDILKTIYIVYDYWNELSYYAGSPLTANHFAEWHDVTAVEPNEEMINSSFRENAYKQIQSGIEIIKTFEDKSFDIIFCHNVLEYIADKEPIIAELLRVMKTGGTLSVVKHNRTGRVFHTAVFGNNPKKALTLLDNNANDKSNYLGTQYRTSP